VSILIRSKGEQALITGDCIHHPCQIEQTQWSSSADFDADAAITTRKDLLSTYADQPTLIIGTHFATPTAGYLRSTETGHYLDTNLEQHP
jgi:glyoxylase-like metal-dependent hydrolase (beta-lactamase superfamily II)